jgi:hypothetical protein
MLIGISGKIGAGKDTFADLILGWDTSYRKKAFAEMLKTMSAMVTGTPIELQYTQEGKNTFIESLGMTIGDVQQKLGNGLRDTLHKDLWVITRFADYTDDDDWIISDMRYKNEAQIIRDKGGFLIRMEGDPGKVNANTKRDKTHKSEIDLDDWTDWDYRLWNTRVDDPEAYLHTHWLQIEKRIENSEKM